MHQFLPAFLLIFLGCTFASPARADETSAGVDLLYPEFAHPQEDARTAIERNDLRFITTDRHHTVPGVESYPRLVAAQGTKFIKQRFRIFATRSQNFSFDIRARSYAADYNRALLRYLLEQRPR